MPGLIFTNNSSQWVLCLDGTVSALINGAEQPNQGTWSTDALANTILLQVTGQPAVSVPVQYSFNGNNQLVVTAPGGAPYPFQGGIDISDDAGVRYTLLDANANALLDANGNALVLLVHGHLSINNQLDQLVITFRDRTTTFITGSQLDGQSVSPDANNSASGPADKLWFFATTTNTYGTVIRAVNANIVFLGQWDLNKDGISFQATGVSGQQASIQLGGTYKGVAAGIAVQQTGNDTDVAFTIYGKHQYKAPSGGTTNVNWSVGLGYSNNQLDAVVKVGASLLPANTTGNSFLVNGTMQFVGGPSNAVELELSAIYKTRSDGQLIFSADVTDGTGGPNYNLSLEGKYTVKSGFVTFTVTLDGGAGNNALTVDFGYVSSNNALKAHMAAVLKSTPAGVEVSFDFELSMQLVDGVLVPAGNPVPLPPAGGTGPGKTAPGGQK